ncbi:toll/interleukin-1 receptor domain-containing protein [Frankia sp. AiPa1]|uniref:toll/interleukin-1 receptor domain-containing protein n=1 Tax=Frankia sp. AiPa1 TaxID=573492 RepID=UPI0027E533DA|nr:toll/interleukin-1 receptor domain-containing protein [Frankia sp. AiPa1]
MPDGEDAPATAWDFFVSYTQADREWAEWVAWQLEDAGYSVLIQAWDFVPGSNWNSGMQRGTTSARRTIAILSEAYLQSVYAESEWQAAHRQDPQGFARKLLPVRIEACDRPGFLGSVISIDLFGELSEDARRLLLDRVQHTVDGRAKPATVPRFPGPESRQVAPQAQVHPRRPLARRDAYIAPLAERRRSSMPTKFQFYVHMCTLSGLSGSLLAFGLFLGFRGCCILTSVLMPI